MFHQFWTTFTESRSPVVRKPLTEACMTRDVEGTGCCAGKAATPISSESVFGRSEVTSSSRASREPHLICENLGMCSEPTACLKMDLSTASGIQQEKDHNSFSLEADIGNSLGILVKGASRSRDLHIRDVAILPSPPPSKTPGSPIMVPVDPDVSASITKSCNGTPEEQQHERRDRAVSSAVDSRGGEKARQILDTKDRARSASRPSVSSRAQSTPLFRGKSRPSKPDDNVPISALQSKITKDAPPPLKLDRHTTAKAISRHESQPPSPIPDAIPIPPLSIPTYLQLELSSSRPLPYYMYRPSTTDALYESTSIIVERLINFLQLAPQLERALVFGTLACADAWLYNFTILPLRFFAALFKLLRSMFRNVWSEIKFLADFVPLGLSRFWHRQMTVPSEPPTPMLDGDLSAPSSARSPRTQSPFPAADVQLKSPPLAPRSSRPKTGRRHRRARSVASTLVSAEKSDIVKGCLIVASTLILMRFDASMMYHNIRGQAAIKLYVIYNMLEVFDRLLSAIGQDILECLFSPESLSRHPNGRSKILRPLSLFPLALVYVLLHSTALYYQVITLNVAVNSYSNALLTLLMSNQFVEIKSTVFKRIEKENLFQMTCADIVERFQLCLMLIIIASRNVIETSASTSPSGESTATAPPASTPTLLPFSFTMFPSLSFSQILSPVVVVLGTEMLVDWLKHAYITKFNNIKPNLYGRFLDILTKDYYGHAFTDANLSKRIGLPVLPLTALTVRAAVQTYHMFLEHLGSAPLPSSVSRFDADGVGPSISPTTAAALRHVDSLFLKVIGHAEDDMTTLPSALARQYFPSWLAHIIDIIPVPSTDTLISWTTTLITITLLYFVLLAFKVVLGMVLLSYARNRYANMKRKEHDPTYAEGRRRGGWGTVELDEDKRRWIYADDPERLKKLRDRDKETLEKEMGSGSGKDGKRGGTYDGVERYKLGASKRIW